MAARLSQPPGPRRRGTTADQPIGVADLSSVGTGPTQVVADTMAADRGSAASPLLSAAGAGHDGGSRDGGPASAESEVTPRFGIGEAATRAGVSERALRYYQELGLIEPSGRTPGGMRRYSADNIARVVRIRELQDLLGLNLEEIGTVFANEDRLEELRRVYQAERPQGARRRALIEEGIALRNELVATVQAKRDRLQEFLDEETATVARLHTMLDENADS